MVGTKLSAPSELRAKWHLQVDKRGRPINEICTIFDISRKTYYKWYKQDHPFGMTGKRSRKMHLQTVLTGSVDLLVIRLKKLYNFGPAKMSAYLSKQHNVVVSHMAIYKFYKQSHI